MSNSGSNFVTRWLHWSSSEIWRGNQGTISIRVLTTNVTTCTYRHYCFTFGIDGLAGYELDRGERLATPPNRPQEVYEIHVPDIHLDNWGQVSPVSPKEPKIFLRATLIFTATILPSRVYSICCTVQYIIEVYGGPRKTTAAHCISYIYQYLFKHLTFKRASVFACGDWDSRVSRWVISPWFNWKIRCVYVNWQVLLLLDLPLSEDRLIFKILLT